MKCRIYASLAFALVLMLLSPAIADAQSTPRVVTLSPTGESYIDPEILPGGDWMTYQSEGGIYLAALDPATGLFRTPGGRDILVDTNAARPIETFNGPEFGIDANGWAVYYAKSDAGSVQLWRATLDASGQPHPTPLTSGARHQTQLVSRNASAPTTHVAAIQGNWQNGMAVWFDAAAPERMYEITPIETGISSMRWVDQSFLLTYSQRTGSERGQVVLLDTATNMARTITADAGDKTDPYGWYAPDYGGDLLVLAVVDNTSIAVYRDLGGDHWERITTLTPPAGSQFDFMSSAEPFVFNGRSYISVIIKDATSNRERFTDSEVWLMAVGVDPAEQYAERCDSGEVGLSRSDPEVYLGDEHVFVYYNVIGGASVTAPYEIHRCQSDLQGNAPAQATLPPASTSACRWVAPQDTDPRIDIALDPHYVCDPQGANESGHLMVFFPGTAATPELYTLFVQEAAAMGMHAIGVSYPNPDSINLEICPRDGNPDCHVRVRTEIIEGQALHPGVQVTPANAINNRLMQLLAHLHAADPDAGWDQYRDGDALRYTRMVVAGHSQGGGMAAFIAHNQPVARAILFSWVDLSRGVVAPWVLEPSATPAEHIFIFEHIDDRAQGAEAKAQMRAAFGVDMLGEANVDTDQPPYDGAHVLLTTLDAVIAGPNPYAAAHNVVVVDPYTPLENGTPVLQDAWRYLLTLTP